MTATASMAPAAPSEWPVTPLIDVTGGPGVPNSFAIASASAASLSGVDVPWALTWRDVGGVEPGAGQGELHAGRAHPGRRATVR